MRKLFYRALLTVSLALLASPLAGQPAALSTQPVGATKRLLVNAPNGFHPSLEAFVAFKQELLPTEFVKLEDVLKSADGVDDPEKLKRFLYTEWHERELGYVLLQPLTSGYAQAKRRLVSSQHILSGDEVCGFR